MEENNRTELYRQDIHGPPGGEYNAAGFAAEIQGAFAHYAGIAGAEMDVQPHDADMNPLSWDAAYPEAFADWKEIRAIWDRRRVVFGVLDDIAKGLGPNDRSSCPFGSQLL